MVRRVVDVIPRELGHLSIADVNYQKLDAYAQALLRDGLKPATVNRRMSVISTALNECVKRGDLSSDPYSLGFAKTTSRIATCPARKR